MAINLYTDGSCHGNPGPGGWGYVLEYMDYRIFGADHDLDTTSNKMELTAVIEGLKAIQMKHIPVIVTSDSEYIVKGITEWIDNWKRKGWRTSRGDPVKNKDLWLTLEEVLKDFKEVSFEWVPGHSGHKWNEYCDELANAATAIAESLLSTSLVS